MTAPLDLTVFQEAAAAAREGSACSFTSLQGSSDALLLCLIGPPYILLCATEERARGVHSDALFWAAVLGLEPPVLVEPAGSPERLKSVAPLYSSTGVGVIAPIDAALAPLWPAGTYPVLTLARGGARDRDELLKELNTLSYLQVPMVTGPGEVSVRGGILDIFPPDSPQPLRVEFFGDEIESLRVFKVETQLSVREIAEARICPAAEPGDGPTLVDFFPAAPLILSEPDDIRRHQPDPVPASEGRQVLFFTALPLAGEGFNLLLASPAGYGLLPEERKSIEGFVRRADGLKQAYSIMMVCSSEGQAKRLRDLFSEEGRYVPILDSAGAHRSGERLSITTGELSTGFVCGRSIILAGTDIFGRRPLFKPARTSKVSGLISSLEDFRPGDYLVHGEHGIGKYLGIRKERIEGHEDDFLSIEYLGGDKLFVPLERITCVQKYHAPEGVSPRMDRLGGKTWQKTRQRVRKNIRDMAEKLLKVYARRTSALGYACSPDSELHREFDGFFPYEATPDQLSSVNEIKRDMESPVPMDRLLCGDVGYGKTEVVMRACFKSVYDGKQVAILVPTTILAEQHYETFTARFAAFPVKIDYLSRFKSRAEQKETLGRLAEGAVDIIIGTHRLLAKDVVFYDLGLLIVDEEHKFGVSHKEKIKGLKSNVDVLCLSATPIPRTLHMALSGIRGMSTIETPPEERLAVKSTVARFNPTMIQEALYHELDRGGQAFFVHNRIGDIHKMGSFLQGLVPGGKIGIAHGQMKEKELEAVMHRFFHQEINILVSTAIIGAGLDIPSANTIIINRADRFGLADLYQLRGRVGRSNVRAFAYFLIPGEDIITEEARKKLQAIQELGYLGAGFRLALKDLEIRGAGNLLGAEQSGHIEAVGFDMYMEMLEQAVAELKGEKTTPVIEPVIDLRVTAIISEYYIENPDLRMTVYRKIASAKDGPALERIYDELRDRFGPPPEETRKLIDIMGLKVMAMKLHISRIQNMAGRVRVLFAPETPVTPEQMFLLHATRKGMIKFLPEGGVELNLGGMPWERVLSEVKSVMEELRRAEEGG
ncbi:MAG: transcription-repair coupling factor, partial [Nitrospiraceae bacterium]